MDFNESKSLLGMNPEQAHRIANYIYSAEAINRSSLKKAATKQEVLARVNELLALLKVPCDITDAEFAGESTESINGNLYKNSLYEVSCANGAGYFLNSRDRIKKEGAKPGYLTAETSFAISCLLADKIHDEDNQNGIKSEFYCHLPDNGGDDVRMVSERLLAAAGVNCKVSQFKWFGLKSES